MFQVPFFTQKNTITFLGQIRLACFALLKENTQIAPVRGAFYGHLLLKDSP